MRSPALAAGGCWTDDPERFAFVAFQSNSQLARLGEVALVGFVDHVNNWLGFRLRSLIVSSMEVSRN